MNSLELMSDFNSYVYKIIGNRVIEFRKINKLSQVELAQKAQIGRTTITNIESGRQQVSIHTLLQIAHALNISIHTLIPVYSEVMSNIKIKKDKDKDKISDFLDKENFDEILKQTIKNIDNI